VQNNTLNTLKNVKNTPPYKKEPKRNLVYLKKHLDLQKELKIIRE
jgi:hypothetical protein